jgi:hypothetical protein
MARKQGFKSAEIYTRAFEEHATKKFVEALDLEPLDLTDFQRLADLIVKEDVRFLPVIVCAFADDLLKATFKAVLPDGIPGGKGSMLSSYGPLSDLAKRIQLAYAFDILSPDLMVELDRIRSARNAISHSWDINSLNDFITKGRVADIYHMEELLAERKEGEFSDGFKPLAAFRIRLVWIIGRLIYEAAAYDRAKKTRLRPARVLYGKPSPKWLGAVTKLILQATKEIAKQS